MTFGRSVTKDLREAGIPNCSTAGTSWALAWREVVRHLAPPGKTKNSDPNTQTTTNQPTS